LQGLQHLEAAKKKMKNNLLS
jgi:hypothetical protein